MPPIDPNRDVREVMEEWLQPTPERRQRIEEGATAMEIGALLYNLRTEAGLTQEELAERVGTSRSSIARVEDAEYQGHSLALLRRVAYALGKEVYILLRDREPTEKPERARELEPAAG